MNPLVQQFCKVSLRYENQIKKKITNELLVKLEPLLEHDQIQEVKKLMKKRIKKQYDTHKKAVMNDEVSQASVTHKSNIMKYLVKELKYNMSLTTPLRKRLKIAQEVIKDMEENSTTLEKSKESVYKKYDIFITKNVNLNVDVTDENNMDIEREYDEFRGSIVYGWDADGEALYEPTFGAYIVPPTFKEAGPKWREVLEERWEQRSHYEEDEALDNYIGN